jgi:hypothetical protein
VRIAIRQELASGALVRLSSPAAAPFALVAMVPQAGEKGAATALIEAVRGALRKRS